jgi:hypothetical protein
MQSSWHNLPEFDPCNKRIQQKAGKEFNAKNVEINKYKNCIRMEIASAYNENSLGLNEYWRKVILTDDQFMIKDETDYKGLIALNLILASEPVIHHVEKLRSEIEIKEVAVLEIVGTEKIEVGNIPIKDAWLKRDWAEKIYRLRIYFHQSIEVTVLN